MPKPRTPEQIEAERARRAKNNKAYRERKKAEAAAVQAAPPLVQDVAGVQAALSAPAAPVPPSGLLGRMRGIFKSEGTSKKKEAELEEHFIFGLVPMASAFLAKYAASRYEGPYQKCAPQASEIDRMLHPLFRIVARRLEISVNLGPDEKDISMFGSMLLAYVFRASADYMEINTEVEKTRAVAYAEDHIRSESRRNGRNEASQGPSTGDAGRGQTASERSHVGTTVESSLPPVETDEQRYRRFVIEAYREDREYRAKNGLL